MTKFCQTLPYFKEAGTSGKLPPSTPIFCQAIFIAHFCLFYSVQEAHKHSKYLMSYNLLNMFPKARQTEKYLHPPWKEKISPVLSFNVSVDLSILIARLLHVLNPSWPIMGLPTVADKQVY